MHAIVFALACASGGGPPAVPSKTDLLVFTSGDGERWERRSEPLSRETMSLGLAVLPDGEARLTGIRRGHVETALDRSLRGTRVHGFRLPPGADPSSGWEPADWEVADPDTLAFIDPQWFEGEMWYVSATGRAGDPVGPERTNRVRAGGRTLLEGKGVADPSPVRFGGELHLFVTAWPVRVEHLVAEAGGGFRAVEQWPGLTVPFATVVGEELWLLAQDNVRGRRQPFRMRSRDGRTWSRPEPVIAWEDATSCTSPVVGRTDRWFLLCVDEGP